MHLFKSIHRCGFFEFEFKRNCGGMILTKGRFFHPVLTKILFDDSIVRRDFLIVNLQTIQAIRVVLATVRDTNGLRSF